MKEIIMSNNDAAIARLIRDVGNLASARTGHYNETWFIMFGTGLASFSGSGM
jgi:hypothetical protein